MYSNIKKIVKHKKLISSLVISLILILAFSSQAFAYPTTWSVSIPAVQQEKSNWCWAAAGVAILDYFNEPVTQSAFVTYIKGSPVNETATIEESKTALAHWNVSSTLTYSSLSFNAIIAEIYNYNRPVRCKWDWSGGGAHAIVLNGYDDDATDYVSYLDPVYGDFYYSTYSYFKGGSGYDHTWTATIYYMTHS